MAATITISPRRGLWRMWRSRHSGQSRVNPALCRFLDCDLDASTELDRRPLCALHRSLLEREAERSSAIGETTSSTL